MPVAIRSSISRDTTAAYRRSDTLARVLPIASVLVDFDGTACAHDVAEHLLIEFGDPSWPEYDAAWERGELDSRRVITAQAAMLGAPAERMLEYALEHCPIEPTFPAFVRWLSTEGVPVTVVSDGFGFYIEPILRAAGLGDVPVITNTWTADGDVRILFENGHAECIGCGTCKMGAVLGARERGAVAFVGEGQSDRYGALYADVAFAKDVLVEIARTDGVPFLPWTTFDDVRAGLEALDAVPGPVGGERCPGWRTA
jgi:2-hydroxy-3-keto-5-methylthiopentenyl-1-phosphate phosphatase